MEEQEVPTYVGKEAPVFPWQQYVAVLDSRIKEDEKRKLVAYKICNDSRCKCKTKCRWAIFERDNVK